MISGTDTKTRTLLPNYCPDHLCTGKLCPALMLQAWHSCNLRESQSLCLASLASAPSGNMAGGAYQCSSPWASDVPVLPGSWAKASLEARMAAGCHGTHGSEEARSSCVGLDSCPNRLVPWDRSDHCLDLGSVSQDVLAGLPCCPGSKYGEVGLSCCPQAFHHKKERSNCVVPSFESREERECNEKWGN